MKKVAPKSSIYKAIKGLAFLTLTTLSSHVAHSSANQFMKTIDYIDKMGSDIYCYWDIKEKQFGVNWKKIITNAKSKISDDTSNEQFKEILTQIASSLHDGHVNYIFDKDKVFYVPIDVKKLGDDYYISNVDKDKFFPTEVSLSPGDRILKINGIDIKQFIAKRSQYISGSTANSIASYAASSINSLEKFKPAPHDTMRLTVEKYTTKEVRLIELPWLTYDRSSHSNEKSLDDIVKIKILPGNIGVLTLTQMHHDSGMDAHIAYIKQAMQTLKNTKALIIDVRNNGGGWGEIGDTVVAHLTHKKLRRYKIQLKNSMQVIYSRPELIDIFTHIDPNNDTYSEWQDVMIEPIGVDSGHAFYEQPVSILTNERCFSACDTFVDSFSSNHLGEVLGTQTGGGTGYPLWIDLPYDFGNFRFSVLRGYSNHGRYLEGTGTLPDKFIQNTPNDLYNQIDGELVQAYRYVLNKIGVESNLSSLAMSTQFKTANPSIIPFTVAQEQRQQLQRHY